ncbi:MAG: tyrosine--tRNA ligase [Anaerolineae bacterium]|nr:tyrosine--tRNA ligase [Thermoflexales bacterium]MDW8408681.1 tyrosine--tRNA ligase [Anaerolineae bacterium]
MATILDELKWRELIYDMSDGVAELLARETITLYNGFDPTANSLHVGHLVPLLALARFQRFGHTPIAVAGGGTGLIGDPSGKSQERQLLSTEQVAENVEAIKAQLARFLDFEVKSNPARVVNNADWLAPLSMMSFLRDIGKHITVNYMLSKDSVKSRLSSESGISFTEFSYMLLQAYDFAHLFQHHGCVLQTGGSDQWGNITAGVELIRRMFGGKAYGLVYPLIVKADGSKFGKTESGSVWLDPRRTSPYRFYQFWFNTDDADVVRYLKFFTWLSEAEVAELAHCVATQPEQRAAQQRLARELTRMTHGETALARAEAASRVLFGGELNGLSAQDVGEIFEEVPASTLPRHALEGEGVSIVDLLTTTGLANSKGDARRKIEGGGVYLNNHQLSDPLRKVSLQDSIEGQFIVLRHGRRNYHLVKLQ